MERIEKHALALAAARALFGAPAAIAPGAVLPNGGRGRYFAGFFGVRELVLAGLLVATRHDLPRLRGAVAFGALADVGDTLLIARELATGRGDDPAAKAFLGTGIAGSVAALALWRELSSVDRA